MRGFFVFFAGMLLCFLLVPMQVQAVEEVDFETERKEMMSYLEKEEVFQELDGFADEQTGISFSKLIESISKQGVMESLTAIGTYIKQVFTKELEANRKNLMQVLILVLVFSILQNFLGLVENSYITELCYVLTYLIVMLFMLKSFSVAAQVVYDMLDRTIAFMRLLLPAYLAVMVFAGGAMSAMAFYELTFFILYGIEVVVMYLLLPLADIYVLFYLSNYILKEEMFSKTAELIKDIFKWGAKIILTLVIGLNVVEGMIAPAMDYASRTTVTKSLGLIPGIGGAAAAISDIFIGSGMVIKNSVGVAAIFLLLVITMVPFFKVLIITLMYKCMAAFLEPVADKRISKAMSGMAEGGSMLMRVITTTVFMIFITVAMMCTTSSMMV